MHQERILGRGLGEIWKAMQSKGHPNGLLAARFGYAFLIRPAVKPRNQTPATVLEFRTSNPELRTPNAKPRTSKGQTHSYFVSPTFHLHTTHLLLIERNA